MAFEQSTGRKNLVVIQAVLVLERLIPPVVHLHAGDVRVRKSRHDIVVKVDRVERVASGSDILACLHRNSLAQCLPFGINAPVLSVHDEQLDAPAIPQDFTLDDATTVECGKARVVTLAVELPCALVPLGSVAICRERDIEIQFRFGNVFYHIVKSITGFHCSNNHSDHIPVIHGLHILLEHNIAIEMVSL